MKMIFFLLFALVFIATPSHVFAQTPSVAEQAPSLAITVSPSATVSPTPTSVDYTLPYPGILADNPLYPLKTLRDNIIGWLISDPLKKANFDLLQSDKRLQIGVYLIKENASKAPLAITTISKGENYLTEAVSKAELAKKQGEPSSDIVHNLHIAILKHEEVIKMLEDQVSDNEKSGLATIYTQELQLDHRLVKGN